MIKKISSFAVDGLALCSIVGIWPRYIEPNILKVTRLDLELSTPSLKGVTFLQFTDLHFHKGISLSFLRKLQKKIIAEKPDLIFFTGDFLCYSILENEKILQEFLSSLKAPLGCFCIFGNHDYASYVSRDFRGDYVIKKKIDPLTGLVKGLKTLFFQPRILSNTVSKEAHGLQHHEKLIQLLSKTPFKLLENKTVTLPIGLNIVGLGEWGLGKTNPDVAFSNYNNNYPGLVLVHNPDSFPLLAKYPGDFVLAGHTHGEQIHFPFLKGVSKKLARLENPEYTRGLFKIEEKKFYVNRGVGAHKPFRLCSPPEILKVTIR